MWLPSGLASTSRRKNLGHPPGSERDWWNHLSPTNLDNFGARYYSSAMGRFMTPDWAAKPTAVPYASFGNPQSLNLYSYVKNNPVTTRDPDGHCDPGSPACALTFFQAVENFAEHPGEWAASFVSGAAKVEAATIRANFGMKPSAADEPSNDIERAGAAMMKGAGQTAAIVLPLIGAGEGGESEGPGALPNDALVVQARRVGRSWGR